MKANELRMGDWVLIPYQNAPIAIPAHETQVQGITIFGEVLTNNTPQHEGLKTHANHVAGIPLTEEWLLKFGFELMPWGWVITLNVKNKKYISNGIRITRGMYFERENGGSVKVEYVHQLQNLYFALTGEELTIKEP